MALSAIDLEPERTPAERRFVLRDVPWHLYVVLRDSLDASGPALRMTYLEGDLELMSPSPEHERTKTLLGRLLETWCAVRGVDLFAQGSTTYRSEKARRGLEADESYAIGAYKDVPDLAIEVVHASYLVDKLEVYRGLGVREVWVFRDGTIAIHVLAGDRYEIAAASVQLPGIDVAQLAAFAHSRESLPRTLAAYRAALTA